MRGSMQSTVVGSEPSITADHPELKKGWKPCDEITESHKTLCSRLTTPKKEVREADAYVQKEAHVQDSPISRKAQSSLSQKSGFSKIRAAECHAETSVHELAEVLWCRVHGQQHLFCYLTNTFHGRASKLRINRQTTFASPFSHTHIGSARAAHSKSAALNPFPEYLSRSSAEMSKCKIRTPHMLSHSSGQCRWCLAESWQHIPTEAQDCFTTNTVCDRAGPSGTYLLDNAESVVGLLQNTHRSRNLQRRNRERFEYPA
ncbi:uncharacterized protein MEPE_01589 [Melanopsichium pennsylvanicum]|uniref:Uncharacterized protein n=1 Tax=Melanopsichium pennsylvanicum TaxID=63383 RepID=A0AAJ4XKP8_9BASI|nr:uncharacterized protein MEPE_01589 [Melanopsichium pennsylvanicum]